MQIATAHARYGSFEPSMTVPIFIVNMVRLAPLLQSRQRLDQSVTAQWERGLMKAQCTDGTTPNMGWIRPIRKSRYARAARSKLAWSEP